MLGKPLCIVKNKPEIEKTKRIIMTISLIMSMISVFMLGVNINMDISLFLLFLSIISFLFCFFSKKPYYEVKFYEDKLFNEKIFENAILYKDIKAIKRGKKYIYLILKDKEDSFFRRGTGSRDLNTAAYVTIFNEIKKIYNTDEIYEKIKEYIQVEEIRDIKNKETESLFSFNYKTNKIFQTITILIATIFSIGLIFCVLIFFCMLFRINIDENMINIFFICICLGIVIFVLYRKVFKLDKVYEYKYEIFDNYLLVHDVKTNVVIEKINYEYIHRIEIMRDSKCMEIYYLVPEFSDEKYLYVNNITKENKEKLKNIIRKSRGFVE